MDHKTDYGMYILRLLQVLKTSYSAYNILKQMQE